MMFKNYRPEIGTDKSSHSNARGRICTPTVIRRFKRAHSTPGKALEAALAFAFCFLLSGPFHSLFAQQVVDSSATSAAILSGSLENEGTSDPSPRAAGGRAAGNGTSAATGNLSLASDLGVISGTVLDGSGNLIPGASVILKGSSPEDQKEVQSNDYASFKFDSVKPGVPYQLSVQMKGFSTWTSPSIVLQPSQTVFLTDIHLKFEAAATSITVYASPEEIAVEQVKLEEKQRVLGFIPDFYVNFDHDPAPMSAQLKFQLARKALTDPVTLAGFAFNAGLYQAAGWPSYRGGMAGYGQRLGATFAGGYGHVLVGDALLPAILHQDPRYFYQGTGTTGSRALHALSSAIFAVGDNGRREINYSGIGGDLVSGALANAYYPQKDRGVGLVFRGAMIGTGGRIAYALGEEFVLNRHFFRRGKKPE